MEKIQLLYDEKIIQIFDSCICTALHKPKPKKHHDQRIRDLQRTPTDNVIFLRQNIARRSLAEDFREWFSKCEGEDIVKNLHHRLDKQASGYSRFLREHKFGKEREDDIRAGLKLLLLEEITGTRSFLVIFCFSHWDFNVFPYRCLDNLAACRRSPQFQEWFKPEREDWIMQCLSEYAKNIDTHTDPCGMCRKHR